MDERIDERMDERIDEQLDERIDERMDERIDVNEIVQLMADFINYMGVSLYEGQFTKNHEDSYVTLHSIYDSVATTPSMAPSLYDCAQFYDNIVYLANVTYTDDPDYYTLKRTLRKYIIQLKYN